MDAQARWVAIAALLGTGGCSLLLDFDQTSADAGPAVVDASTIDPEAIQAFEPNDDFENAGQIVGGRQDALAIAPGSDQDFYYFDLDQRSDVIIDIFPDQDGTDAELGMQLFGSDQQPITDAILENRISRRDGEALDSGTYYLQINAASGQARAYSLQLQISTAASAP